MVRWLEAKIEGNVEKFKNIALSLLIIIGVIALLISLGIYIERQWMKNTPRRIEMTIVERPFELPPKTEEKKATRVKPDSARIALEDSVYKLTIVLGKKDSLARAALEKKESTFEDTLSYADSLGSFSVREIHKISYDGMTDKFTKTTTYTNGKLTTVKVTEFIYLESTLFDILTKPLTVIIVGIAFVAGLLL